MSPKSGRFHKLLSFVTCGKVNENFVASQRTNVASPCPVYYFLFKTAQLVESEALSYIAGRGVSYYGHVVQTGGPI